MNDQDDFVDQFVLYEMSSSWVVGCFAWLDALFRTRFLEATAEAYVVWKVRRKLHKLQTMLSEYTAFQGDAHE